MNKNREFVIELFNIVNLGSAIKVTNDFIITQQGEH
jgi:hypothetical protein